MYTNILYIHTFPATCFVKALKRVDEDVMKINLWKHQGSTACIVYINDFNGTRSVNSNIHVNDPNDVASRCFLTINLGDSRIVLARGVTAIDLTTDHSPETPQERHRIEAAGGFVAWHGMMKNGRPVPGTGVYRVNGNLALSRAVGDKALRPYVSGDPDVRVFSSRCEDDFIIAASDGL